VDDGDGGSGVLGRPGEPAGGSVEDRDRGVGKDRLEPVGVDAADGLSGVPPEAGHVDELRLRVKEPGDPVGVGRIPRIDPALDDAFRTVGGAVAGGGRVGHGGGEVRR